MTFGSKKTEHTTIALEQHTLQSNFLHSQTLSVDDFSLKAIEGPAKGKRCRLDKEVLYIGRAPWCDFVLDNDRRVSNVHCTLIVEADGIRVQDQNSRNGVFLQDQRILDAYLSPGARLQIGETTLQLVSHEKRKDIEVRFFDASGTLIGRSDPMRRLFSLIQRIAPLELPVLLTGETGTGKSSVAQAVHQQSPGKKGPFVVVNCGALPATMIEALLFGHEKGAFTDAKQRHIGFFEQAHQGTLFLDEIGELPLDLQPRLLDVVERRRVRRVGGNQEIQVDFRLITATNRDLRRAVKQNLFREDLYYRLSVVELNIPPLRERPEDIALLADYLLHQLSQNPLLALSESAKQILSKHLWPGNVRQLRNTLERTIAFLEGHTIQADDLYLPPTFSHDDEEPPTPTHDPQSPELPDTPEGPISLKDLLAETEKNTIERALLQHEWNVPKTAKYLTISKAWLYERIKRHGLQRPK